MEIPYTVTARKDTGLFNSKIGIWLFLASEVMLFGGLFSGYVFLRIYADYPWPERALPVLPGLINTFVLIGSSVTVVFAWASLKMRQWFRFQVFMAITIFCAFIFMVLKGIEYNAKWHHQAVRMDDYLIVEGHTHKAKVVNGKFAIDHGDEHAEGHEKPGHGKPEHGATGEKGAEGEKAESHVGTSFLANRVLFEAEELTYSLTRFHAPWVKDVLVQAKERGSDVKVAAKENTFLYGAPADYEWDETARTKFEADLAAKYAGDSLPESHRFGKNSLYVPKGTPLEVGLLREAQEIFVAARAQNSKARTAELRKLWKKAHAENPGVPNWEIAGDVEIDPAKIQDELVGTTASLTFSVNPPAVLVLKRGQIKRRPLGKEITELGDDTSIRGHLQDSPIALAVDAVDFRYMAQKAVEARKDPMAVIEGCWIFSDQNEHAEHFHDLWNMHKKRIEFLEVELAKADREPTDTERYRIGWKDFVQYARAEKAEVQPGSPEFDKLRPSMTEGFAGPNHKRDEYKTLHPFPELEIPQEKVFLESMFTPKWNTYYAVYFTLTGLHGLHVIGGAIVLSYFLFFSKGLYRRNPEWLANRVEVGGLFWHFVDLVWIFLFPILYLM